MTLNRLKKTKLPKLSEGPLEGLPRVLGLAWAYVALRVVHSLVQVSRNHIPTRFVVFALSSFVLIALTLRGVQQLS